MADGRLATAAAALSAGLGSCSHLTCVAGPYLQDWYFILAKFKNSNISTYTTSSMHIPFVILGCNSKYDGWL